MLLVSKNQNIINSTKRVKPLNSRIKGATKKKDLKQ